jgi:zinc transporter 9
MRARLRLLLAATSDGRRPGGAARALRAARPASCAGAARAVLGLSFVVEGYSLLVATRSVVAGAAAAGLGTMEFIKRGMDPTSIAVMLEDGAAVTGLVIAGAAGA